MFSIWYVNDYPGRFAKLLCSILGELIYADPVLLNIWVALQLVGADRRNSSR